MSSGDIDLAIERAIANIDAVIRPHDVVVQLSGFASQYGLSGVLMIAPPLMGDTSGPERIVDAVPSTLHCDALDTPSRVNAMLSVFSGAGRSAAMWSVERPIATIDNRLACIADCFDVETYSDGLVVSAQGANGLTGVVVMGGNQPLSDHTVVYLKLMAVYAFDRACALQRAELRRDYGLSDREFECVKWVAAGKTDWEIGQILTISPKTVNYHVENAKRKMSVQTRVQAVVSALLSGGISE